MEKIIEVKNVTFEYNREEDGERVAALDDVSLDIKEGEFVAVIGHNGSGKSTLAKNFNALLIPTSGQILVNGKDTSLEENVWAVRQSAGMVFQNPDNQLVSAIVEDDVAFGPENLGIPSEKIKERVSEALNSVGMYEFRGKAPHLLSGGQKQRIAIAGVIAMRPDCIVFDEPTAMLDPNGRKEVMSTILKLNKEEGITIIHITHFMEEAVQADRVVVIDDGKIVMQGKPAEVFLQVEKLKALRLEVPVATELAHRLRKQGIEIPTDILTIDEMVNWICR